MLAMAHLIMASSEVDGLPSWLAPGVRVLQNLLVRRFRSAVADDQGPYLPMIADLRARDVNIRPSEVARIRRLVPPGSSRPVLSLSIP
jgi:hypothetical protein